MQVLCLLHVHVLWHVEICRQTFMLKIVFVCSGMKLLDDTNPGRADVKSNDSALQTIVLPILIVIALLAISLAILYAFLRHFRLKRKEDATETNQQVVTLCIRTNKLTASMQCWRRVFQPVILLFDRIYRPSFSSRLFTIYALSYTAPSEHGLACNTQKFPKFLCRTFTIYRNSYLPPSASK